jgi:hypothetical protein
MLMLAKLADENERLQVFKKVIYSFASRNREWKDQYIMDAKQAIDDYEKMGGHYQD